MGDRRRPEERGLEVKVEKEVGTAGRGAILGTGHVKKVLTPFRWQKVKGSSGNHESGNIFTYFLGGKSRKTDD